MLRAKTYHEKSSAIMAALAQGSVMIFTEPLPQPDPLRARLRAHYRADESGVVQTLLAQAELPADLQDRIATRARQLVRKVRENRVGQGGIDAFMHAYELSSKEGVVLMCLAEALLRIPDSDTAEKLIPAAGFKILATETPRTLGTMISRFQRIDVEGAEPRLLDAIRALPGVGSVSPRHDGAARIEVNEEGATREVLRRLVEAGVTSVKTSLPSLEEVYVQVIGERGLEI